MIPQSLVLSILLKLRMEQTELSKLTVHVHTHSNKNPFQNVSPTNEALTQACRPR